MSVSSLPIAPSKRGPQRTAWFATAKTVWRADFHAGRDPFEIVGKGVSENTVKQWVQANSVYVPKSKPEPQQPSREALYAAYREHMGTELGLKFLRRALSAHPSIADLDGAVVEDSDSEPAE